jgi:hypothetical protein
MPEPAAIVCTDDTTPMIVKYMMSSRLGELWAVEGVDRGCALAKGVAENLPSVHRFLMPDRTLSGNGNPELRTLRALLDAMGLRLSIAPAS